MAVFLRFCFIILLLFSKTIAMGQPIKGQVVNSQDDAPIPFVHIGVVDKNLGTIADENGLFSFDLTQTERSESLTFSSVGFDDFILKLDTISSSLVTVKMRPANLVLNEATVRAKQLLKKKKKPKKIGRMHATEEVRGGSGIGHGGEMGVLINIPNKDFKINAVNFHTWSVGFDSILYRINIYETQNGMPGESVLEKELFVIADSGNHWINKDLTSDAIFVKNDVVVAIEPVKGWRKANSASAMYFTNGTGYQSSTYRRRSSQDRWTEESFPKIPIYIEVQEYK